MLRRPAFTLLHALPLTLALLGSGCVHYAPKPLDPASSAARLTGRRLAAKTWTFEALAEETLHHHPDVALAKAQYETARATIRTAGERPNPTVTLAPQFAFPQLVEGTYTIDFDWTIETAGKRSRRLEVASANGRAAAARVVDAVWKVRAAVRKAMLELYGAG